MKEIKDPRRIYDQQTNAYRVIHTISRSYCLENLNDERRRIELTRNSVTIELNPLLAEMGLFDVVTIEERIQCVDATLPAKLQLITSLRKATHAEIRSFIPNAILEQPDLPRVYELGRYIQNANYIPEILRTELVETIKPQEASPTPATLILPVTPHSSAAGSNGSRHNPTNGNALIADSAE